MGTPEGPTAEIVDEAKSYEQRAEASPETVASDLPRLLELLERDPDSKQEVVVRDAALTAIYELTRHNPDRLNDLYPEIIEQTLDTPEAKLIARDTVHQWVELVSDDIPPERICDTAVSFVRDEFEMDSCQTHDGVPGHGAAAMQAYQHVTESTNRETGRPRLILEALTDAFSGLVKYRASKRGVDPIDGFVDLQAAYRDADNPEPFTMGFGPDGAIVDVAERGEVYSEPYQLWYTLSGLTASTLVVLVERTAAQMLRTEAVLAERIY
jgi:hypothetical protein